MDRKQSPAADCSDHRIHLYDGSIRILPHEGFEFLIGASNAAALIDFELRLFTADAEPNFPWKIDVADIQKTAIDVVVDRLLAAHELILIGNIDLMDRMSLLHKRRNDPAKPGYFCLAGRQAASGFRDYLV